MEKLIDRLDNALFEAQENLKHKPWLKALTDLDAIATSFNSKIEAFTHKRLGTTLISVSAISMPPNTHPAIIQMMEQNKVYRFSLVSEGRTKVEMDLSIFSAPKTGTYPVLILGDNFQPVVMLDCRARLEDFFVGLMCHADSKFMSAVLGQNLIKMA